MCAENIKIVPLNLADANVFVWQYHRHHKKTQGMKFAIGLRCKCGQLHGVAICGRPLSRTLDNGMAIEVTRVCVKEGVRNACSKLYGACARIAREMGYQHIITYILMSDTGTSLRASGWLLQAENCGTRPWNTKKRQRTVVVSTLFGEEAKYPVEYKQRWIKTLN